MSNSNRFTVGRIAKNWAPWKIKLVDFIFNHAPVLRIGFANRLIHRLKDYKNGEFARQLCKELNITTEVHGLENLVTDGPITIAANHPGGGDIMAITEAIDRIRPDFIVPANELVCIKSIEEVTIPIKMAGKEKMDKRILHRAYEEGKVVLFFAGGKNSRFNKEGLLRDRRWRTTFLDFAQQYNTPIHLFRIDSQNSPLFYKVSKLRQQLSFLKNIPLENLFQLRELARPMHIKLYLSPPFYYKSINETEAEKRQKADLLYQSLYQMDENNLNFYHNI